MEQSQHEKSIKGLNYGKYHLSEDTFEMEYEGDYLIRIPFDEIVNSCV